MRTERQKRMDRWLFFAVAAALLLLLTWRYSIAIANDPSHRVVGAFLISGRAATLHQNPYAIYPGIWSVHANPDGTGPLVHDVNLQPPCMLPLFQLLAAVPGHAVSIWLWASAAAFIVGAIALLVTFPGTVGLPLILLLLISEPTLSNQRVGEDFALLFALAAAATCLLHRNRPFAASLCIGALTAAHPNFGLWPLLLVFAGERRIALQSAAAALVLSILPIILYGSSIYPQWIHALAADNHSWMADDISTTGLLTRAAHPAAGLAISVGVLCALPLLAAVLRHQPITLGGIAGCAAILFSPLAWPGYLVAVFPFLAPRRLDPFALSAAVLLILWSRPWIFLTGHLAAALGGIPFVVAACLLLLSFYRASRTRPVPQLQPSPSAA
jgi:hypothetical protein